MHCVAFADSETPTPPNFTTMLSSITAAIAARSYSLDTLGEASMNNSIKDPKTDPSMKPSSSTMNPSMNKNSLTKSPTKSYRPVEKREVQRSGSLKTSTTSFSSTISSMKTDFPVQNPPTSSYIHQKSRSSNPVMNSERAPLASCANTIRRFAQISLDKGYEKMEKASEGKEKPKMDRQMSSGLVYAQRMLVNDSPPRAPPPLPRPSPQKLDLEIHNSNSCDF